MSLVTDQPTEGVTYPGGACLGPSFPGDERRANAVWAIKRATSAQPSAADIAKIHAASREFARMHNVQSIFLVHPETGKQSAEAFVEFYAHAHAFFACNKCHGTPIGRLHACTNRCVPGNIYILCNACFTGDTEHACAPDATPAFETIDEPMSIEEYEAFVERHCPSKNALRSLRDVEAAEWTDTE